MVEFNSKRITTKYASLLIYADKRLQLNTSFNSISSRPLLYSSFCSLLAHLLPLFSQTEHLFQQNRAPFGLEFCLRFRRHTPISLGPAFQFLPVLSPPPSHSISIDFQLLFFPTHKILSVAFFVSCRMNSVLVIQNYQKILLNLPKPYSRKNLQHFT